MQPAPRARHSLLLGDGAPGPVRRPAPYGTDQGRSTDIVEVSINCTGANERAWLRSDPNFSC